MGFDSVNNYLLRLLLASILTYSCGDNPSTMVQGPFKDSAFNNGLICFQNSKDKRNVDFYQSYSKKMANTIARLIPLTTQMRQQRSYRFSLHLLQVKDM